MSTSKRCLFMGLPNSGKSTYIGALWHVLETGEIESTYTIDTQPENRAYLNFLRDAWIEFRPPQRTSGTHLSNIIAVNVVDRRDGTSFELVFPDPSGEFFEAQFAYRKLSKEYIEMIKSMDGIVLFVNPDYLVKSNLITEGGQLFYDKFFTDKSLFLGLNAKGDAKRAAVAEVENSKGAIQKVAYIEWEPKLSQTQVVLIDLLQMVMDLANRSFRVAVVVSAWDTIKDLPGPDCEIIPDKWFSKHLPLLTQFFRANNTAFNYKVFGISAQGGSYKGDRLEELCRMPVPAERIMVQQHEDIENDIALPIKWLLNG